MNDIDEPDFKTLNWKSRLRKWLWAVLVGVAMIVGVLVVFLIVNAGEEWLHLLILEFLG